MQIIANHQYDLTKPVYLIHPNNKFWELTLQGNKISYKVGKLKDKEESAIQKIQKDYSSIAVAKATALQKISQKLTKGYVGRDSKKVESQKSQPSIAIKRPPPSKKTFSGQYFEKGNQSIKLQINGRRVKTTKIGEDKKQGSQIRTFQNNEKAIQFCLSEEQWLKNEGYKAMNHKFIYTFVDDMQEQKKYLKNKTKTQSNKNVLSITEMTDQAMSHKSRENSSAKSDRSYKSYDFQGGKYMDTKTKLGSPTSTCIKVLLAQTYNQGIDPTGWIMSQKLDGVRCFWTGSVMYSRNGNRFFFPKFFTQNWPNSQLDGQLFIGRGKFSQTISAIKKGTPIDQQWRKVKYLVFDCPGLRKPFKQRIKAMQQVLGSIDNPYIKCHAHRQCKGFPDLFAELDKVNSIQGQGLMLRDPQSLYQNRRSKSLLKVKTFHDDQAVVLGYTEGTGRCQGMVGALKVRNTHGVEFEVGSGLTDAERKRPPKIGTKITYKYQQFNKDSGKPRFPTFLRVFEQSI